MYVVFYNLFVAFDFAYTLLRIRRTATVSTANTMYL